MKRHICYPKLNRLSHAEEAASCNSFKFALILPAYALPQPEPSFDLVQLFGAAK